MGKNKTANFSSKLTQFVKNSDTFGTPVSLTYKNDPQIKSALGGFFTLLARLGVAIYFLIQCIAVLNKQKTIQTSLLKRDLTTDTTENKLTLDNFDYGVRLEYIFFETQPEVQENLDQYVYLQISQNIYTWVKDDLGTSVFKKQKIKTELGSCSNGRLGLAEGKNDFLSLKAGYFCPEKIDYRMKGSFSGEESKFIQVRVGYCNQTYLNEKYNSVKQCKSNDEILRVAANLKLYFVIQNSYFDSNDFSGQPIKTFLKPYYLTTKNYTSLYYYMALSSNVAKYNDNILYGTATYSEFIETRVDYQVTQEVPTSEKTPNAFMAIYIQMDDSYKVVDRKVTTIIDALQTTGGFMTVIFVLILVIISRLQKTIYHMSLIKSLYKYQKTKPKKGEESMFSDEDDNEGKPNSKSKVDPDKCEFSAKDQNRKKKQMMFERIIDQIRHRRKLVYGLSTSISNFFKKFICKKLKKKQLIKEILYKRGQYMIQKDLDIRHIAKQLKTLKFMAKVMLTKHQRFMIAYFKENLLNNKNSKEGEPSKKDHTGHVRRYLKKAVANCTEGKNDARLLKNIDYSEDDEILQELIKQLPKKRQSAAQNTSTMNKSFMSSARSNKKLKSSTLDLSNFKGKTTNIDDYLNRQSQKSIRYMLEDNEESKFHNSTVTNFNTGLEKNLKDTSIFDKYSDVSKVGRRQFSNTMQGNRKHKPKNKAPNMAKINFI